MAFVMTPEIFEAITVKKSGTAEMFATCFATSVECVNSELARHAIKYHLDDAPAMLESLEDDLTDEEAKKLAEELKAAQDEAEKIRLARERDERIAVKAKKFEPFKTECAGFTVPGSLITIMAKGLEMAKSLSDTDSTVSVGYRLVLIKDEWKLEPVASGLGSNGKSSATSNGSRTYRKFDYYHNGNRVDGSLKKYLQTQFPNSPAVAKMAAYDSGEKKGAIGAWQALDADAELKAQFKQVEVKD